MPAVANGHRKSTGVSILTGIGAAAGAIALLLSDVLSGEAPLALQHWLMPLLVALSIAAGHMGVEALRQGSWWALAFGAAFCGLLLLTVYNSAGRQSETAGARAATAAELGKRRARVERELAEGREIIIKHRKERDLICAKHPKGAAPDGRTCAGLERTVRTWEAALVGYESQLRRLAVPRPVDGGADTFAGIADILGWDGDQLRRVIVLIVPLLFPLALELLSIGAFGYGFSRHATVSGTVSGKTFPRQETTTVAGLKKAAPEGQQAIEAMLAALKQTGRPVSNAELAILIGVSEGETSKRVAEAERQGVVRKARVGRQVAIVAL